MPWSFKNLTKSNVYLYKLNSYSLKLIFNSAIDNQLTARLPFYAHIKEFNNETVIKGLFGLSPLQLVIFPLILPILPLLHGNIKTGVFLYLTVLLPLIVIEIMINSIPLRSKSRILDFIEKNLGGTRRNVFPMS